MMGWRAGCLGHGGPGPLRGALTTLLKDCHQGCPAGSIQQLHSIHGGVARRNSTEERFLILSFESN